MFKDGLHLIEYAELVEIEVNSIQSVYKFPQNNENIEKGNVEYIFFYSNNEIDNSPKNRNVVSSAVLRNSFVSIFNKNINSLVEVPIVFFWNFNYYAFNYFYLNNININFSMSSIYVNNTGQTALNIGESFLILFIYSENKEKCKC